jgi:hypothetical protein
MQLRNRLIGGASIALAAGTMIAGATLTTAAIASPQETSPEVTIEQLTQDGAGGWISCTVSADLDLGENGPPTYTEAADAEVEALLAEMEAAVEGAEPLVVPSDAEVRPGSAEECAGLDLGEPDVVDVADAVASLGTTPPSGDFTIDLIAQNDAGEWVSCPLDMTASEDVTFEEVEAGEMDTFELEGIDESDLGIVPPSADEIRAGTAADCAAFDGLGDSD